MRGGAIAKPNLARLEPGDRSLTTARGADKVAVALAARDLMAVNPQAVMVTLGARAVGRDRRRQLAGGARPTWRGTDRREMPWPRA